MTALTQQQREAWSLLIAQAFDREDAALMGEANPWDNSPWPDDSQDEAEWRSERIACGLAALAAVLPVIREAVYLEIAECFDPGNRPHDAFDGQRYCDWLRARARSAKEAGV